MDLIVTCLNHPAAANQTFMASDGEHLSIADLLMRMVEAQGTPARLFCMPLAALTLRDSHWQVEYLSAAFCSFQVDITKTTQLLDWTPLVSVDGGLRRAAMPAKG